MSPQEWITLVETPTFVRRAEKILTQAELEELRETLAENPVCGDVIPGSGGLRKTRIRAQKKGKSGGARVIYYFYNESLPLFLLDVYAKSEKVNITKETLKIISRLVDQIQKTYGA